MFQCPFPLCCSSSFPGRKGGGAKTEAARKEVVSAEAALILCTHEEEEEEEVLFWPILLLTSFPDIHPSIRPPLRERIRCAGFVASPSSHASGPLACLGRGRNL